MPQCALNMGGGREWSILLACHDKAVNHVDMTNKTDSDNPLEIQINGKQYLLAEHVDRDYVPRSSVPLPLPKTGNRYALVVTSGWVFVGDLTEENGRILLRNAIGVDSWERIAFNGLCAQTPDEDDAVLRPYDEPVDVPADCEIFRVKVCDDWGKRR